MLHGTIIAGNSYYSFTYCGYSVWMPSFYFWLIVSRVRVGGTACVSVCVPVCLKFIDELKSAKWKRDKSILLNEFGNSI